MNKYSEIKTIRNLLAEIEQCLSKDKTPPITMVDDVRDEARDLWRFNRWGPPLTVDERLALSRRVDGDEQ